jgi:hypothetical protein
VVSRATRPAGLGYRSGEVIVKFREGTSSATAQTAITQSGGREARYSRYASHLLVSLDAGTTVPEALERLRGGVVQPHAVRERDIGEAHVACNGVVTVVTRCGDGRCERERGARQCADQIRHKASTVLCFRSGTAGCSGGRTLPAAAAAPYFCNADDGAVSPHAPPRYATLPWTSPVCSRPTRPATEVVHEAFLDLVPLERVNWQIRAHAQ